MNWSEALAGFLARNMADMSQRHCDVMTEYKENNMSIPGLWSYRGWIWKKYEGSYPTPEEVGLPSGHSFFDPDVVCVTQIHYSNGRKGVVEQYYRGRRIKPGHRLYRPPTLRVGA